MPQRSNPIDPDNELASGDRQLRRRIAFLTMDSLADFVSYDHLAVAPLNQLGWDVVDVSWHSTSPRWDDFAAVVIRTPWDYHLDVDAFLSVLDDIESSRARLINPLSIVRWNIDKSYLRELETEGVPTVPTQWVKSPTRTDLLDALDIFATDELVIKPTVGAGARDTLRWRRELGDPLTDSLQACFRDRDAMIQPFLESVVGVGEWSLFYFGGRYSHTILKTPKSGDFRVQEEYGSRLRAADPTPDQFHVAESAMTLIPEPPVYARVDLVDLPHGKPAVIELELIEPSLYFPFDIDSPKRFARALDDALHA